ncbi:type II toxin-antitoxin system VapC family toxin [Spirosoma panaciterrae]|uniref:type II toxin-antitoxin system VapC family toxin n=1 Tax=Spirosoma panaciterrae TaxID=496058 RepID=UPI0003817682|nr:hypothetical protein [Spirosoma panaciterrae]
MKPTKPISEWRNIFLDTSVIIDFLQKPEKFGKNPPVQKRIEFVHQIMAILGSGNSGNGSRRFYVSAITVAELKHLQRPHTTKDIVNIFNGADVMFIDFTKDIALLLNNSLEKNLSSDQIKQWKANLVAAKLSDDQHVSARQWISDDMKIIASVKAVKNIDVVLTCDHKTFKPITDRFEVPCLTMNEEEFPHDMFGAINQSGLF